MYLKPFITRRQTERIWKLLLTVAVILYVTAIAHGQNVIRSTSQKDMDRVLVTQPVSVSRSEEDSHKLLKMVNEDFLELQRLRERMMEKASAHTEVDYSSLSKIVSQIKGKARSVQSNLVLPEASVDVAEDRDFTDAVTFKAALLLLDERLNRFLVNPIFQASGMDVVLATQASNDLRSIIDLSEKLRKAAKKLKSAN
jgi:hypothetical protein